MQISLYCGAHKTATTHLQGIMLANRAALDDHGVALSAPQDIRNDWLPDYFLAVRSIVQNRRFDPDIATRLRALRPRKPRWVLTEENMIGVPLDLSTRPGLYPFARHRLATVRKLFPKADLKVYFSVRSYDSFFRSMYSEVVRNRGFVPFDEFYDADAFATKSWFDTVSDFVSVLPAEDICLWRFEDFRAIYPAILSHMTGIDDVQPLIDAYAAETTRPSLSQKTIDLLSELAPAVGPKDALRLTERINNHYGIAQGYAPFQPFTDDVIEDMRARYRADMDRITETFPRLTLFTPDAAA